MTLTKQDLQEIAHVLDKRLLETEASFDAKLIQYQGAIIEATNFKFENLERRMDEFDRKLDKLATTLDNFVKMMTDYKEEFILLKAEVDQIKMILKEKLRVEVSIQR